MATIAGLYDYLIVRGDTSANPVPRGLATRSGGQRAVRGVPLIRAPRTLPRVVDPADIDAFTGSLRTQRDRVFGTWLAEHHPEVVSCAELERHHIESFSDPERAVGALWVMPLRFVSRLPHSGQRTRRSFHAQPPLSSRLPDSYRESGASPGISPFKRTHSTGRCQKRAADQVFRAVGGDGFEPPTPAL